MFFFYSRPVQEHKIICRTNYINTQNEQPLKSILVNMKNQHSSDINNDAHLKLKITMLKTVSEKDSETLIRSTRS